MIQIIYIDKIMDLSDIWHKQQQQKIKSKHILILILSFSSCGSLNK